MVDRSRSLAAVLTGASSRARRGVPGAVAARAGCSSSFERGRHARLLAGRIVIWTPIASTEADGVQDRYVLPVLPAIALVLAAVASRRPPTTTTSATANA